MPINKDLSVSPYFDDFDQDKNFYKVLFKPGTAVQVRELNQLQTALQNQIEKFGNNVYKRGTIIDGVNFVYHTNYNYVKLNDSQLDGVPAAPAIYVGNFAVDPTTNLTAHIINSQDGYESTDPNLKTVYLRYINSGDSGTETAFAPGSTLTVYDYLDSMNQIIITNGSSGFANNDSVVFCSAIAVSVTSGTGFTVGETVTQQGNTNFAIVDEITTVRNKTVLKLRPRLVDISNTAVSANTWTFTPGLSIIGSASNTTANVDESIGNGAKATLTTSADVGRINDITINSRGSGYYVTPYIAIKSSGTTNAIGPRNYTDLLLVGRNYIAQIVVSTKANSVGTGYAFGVTEGVIYQKGYFLNVKPQTVIVDKYNSLPDQLAIGFDSVENIIDSNSDDSLLDNSTGTRNEFAPGADRLNIEPRLVVVTTNAATSNAEFFSIVEFSEGYPYRENKRTQFNSLMDEMAIRTNEQSGNFVIDPFLVTTTSTSNQNNEGQSFAVVTDPGVGYINGYRVQTFSNYVKNVDKGIDSRTASNISASIDYGNYVLVNNYNGVFNFNQGTILKLYNTVAAFNPQGNIPTSVGTQIGTARLRNVVYDSGEVGTPSAVYRMYLFDIKMNNSKNFSDVRSVFYDSTNDGIADVVLQFDATSNSNIAKLQDVVSGTSLLIDTGSDSTNNLGNLTYVYRTVNESVEVTPSGTISVLLSASEESFAYDTASLTDADKKELVIVPVGNNVVMQVNATAYGTASVDAGSNLITLSVIETINRYSIGDYVALYSAPSNYAIRRVTGKTSTQLQLDSNAGFTLSNANFSKVFPKGVPVALTRLTGASAVLTNGNKTLNVNLGSPIESNVNVGLAVSYDVKVTNATPTARTPTRNRYVKLALASNDGQYNGPWCLGIPDVFRLRGVYLSNSNNVTEDSTNVTDQFFIDHNQTTDYLGLSYLYKRPDSNITLDNTSVLLVKFDAFTGSNGVRTVNSYVSANTTQRFINDSLTLDNLGTKVNTFEIPEVYSATGVHFDLINCIDFRPVVANTVVYATTQETAPINPTATITFDNSNKKFPLPETAVSFDRSYFLGRKDIVVINTNNRVDVVRGVPSTTQPFADPKVPTNSIVLKKLVIPSYPCVPEKFSYQTFRVLDKKMANERLLVKRIRDKTVTTETTNNDIAVAQPKVYTMADVGQLDRRIKDLEYTVSLSLVESDLKDKVIPSQVNPSLNRFKFGFFVDDYSTKKNSDIDSSEYQADVIDSRVVPITQSTLVTHGKGYRLSGFNSQVSVVKQDQASEAPPPPVVIPPEPELPPIVVTPEPTPVPTPIVAPTPVPTVEVLPPPPVVVPTPAEQVVVVVPPVPIVTSKEVSMYRSYKTANLSKGRDQIEINPGTLVGKIRIEYNVGSKSETMVVNQLRTAGGADGLDRILYNGKFSKATGTLEFDYDPAFGRYFDITIMSADGFWEYTVYYPIDSTTYAEPAAPATNVNTLSYSGTLASIFPGYVSAQALGQNFGTLAYVTQGVNQVVVINGLRPNTVHNLIVSDNNVTAEIIDNNSAGLSPTSIRSDEYGTASFNITLNVNAANGVYSLLGTSNIASSSLARNVLCSLSSIDNTSNASWYLNTGSAAPTTVATPPASPVVMSRGSVGRNAIGRVALD